MQRFGNLENLALGMGLEVKHKDTVPTRYRSLDGWGLVEINKTKKYLGFFAILLIIFIAYKILYK